MLCVPKCVYCDGESKDAYCTPTPTMPSNLERGVLSGVVGVHYAVQACGPPHRVATLVYTTLPWIGFAVEKLETKSAMRRLAIYGLKPHLVSSADRNARSPTFSAPSRTLRGVLEQQPPWCAVSATHGRPTSTNVLSTWAFSGSPGDTVRNRQPGTNSLHTQHHMFTHTMRPKLPVDRVLGCTIHC